MKMTTNYYAIIAVFAWAIFLLSSSLAHAVVTTTTYYHTDALGSIVAASDEEGGVIWRKTYDSYGREVISTDDGQVYEGQAYTGKPYDKETGLLYLNQRYYDPQLRRFISMDPVGFTPANPTSFNRYAYANNNPYKFVDPDGRSALAAFGGLIHESIEFTKGNGFNWGMVGGAFVDGYNGEGDGFGKALFDDVTSFVPLGAIAASAIKVKRLYQARRTGDATKGQLALPSLQVANAGGKIISEITKKDEVFFRVFSGNSTAGGFLTRVAPTSRNGAIEGLALPPGNTAEFIQRVLVPAGTRLQRSRALPAFGRRGGKEQFELLDQIPTQNFGPGVPFK